MKKNIILGILFIIVIISLIFILQKLEFSGVDIKIGETIREFEVEQLDNGMTITVKETKAVPLVAIQFWVKTGSINEQDLNRGIAHIFEHIWFKGTPSQPMGSFDKKIASYGGKANAMTAQDYTAFYVTVPKEKFAETLSLMADLLKNQLFDPIDIEKEKEVILEEQKIIQNDPKMFTDEEFGLLLLKEHSYRHPVIGYKETISSATPETIKGFYREWYAPNNINLVVVGDVNKEDVLREAKLRFNDMQAKELPKIEIPLEKLQVGMNYKIKTRKGLQNTYIALGYRTSGFMDEDWYALRVLTQILDGAENSRIQRIVKTEKELISASDTYFTPLKHLGAMETLLVLNPEVEEQAIIAVIDEYKKFKKQKVSLNELRAAKKQLEAGYAQQQEELTEQAKSIGNWWVAGRFLRQPYYLEDINKVTREDIQLVAEKYFTNPTIFVLRPE